MKRMSSLVLIAATLTMSACGGGSSGYGDPPPPMAAPPPPAAPPAASQTNFTTFMRAQFESSGASDTAEPVDVESMEWVFTDDDDEAEYDDVLATSM